MNLRKRCEKFKVQCGGLVMIPTEELEAFAREIRDEALEEVLFTLNCGGTSCPKPCRSMCMSDEHKAIRALKTDALAASAKEE